MEVMKRQLTAVRPYIHGSLSFFSNVAFTCNSTEIRCANSGGGRTCVPKSWMCDGAR